MQAKLSSFITSHRPKRKHSQTKSPFSLRLFDGQDSPSPHPYASPAIFDIKDVTNNGDADSETSSFRPPPLNSTEDMDSHINNGFPRSSETNDGIPSVLLRRKTPSHVKLDVNISPEQLSDLFPAHFLDTDPSRPELPRNHDGPSTSHNTTTQQRVNSSSNSSYRGEDSESTYSSDVVANLEAMNASTFVHSNEKQEMGASEFPTPRKFIPSPIKIPNTELNRHPVQLVQTSRRLPSDPRPTNTSPDDSYDDASAVSGTTLARALLANTFVLSSDKRTSRHRSGASVLTRTDSATLPHGEHPFYHTSFERDGTLSGGSNDSFFFDSSGDHVPPVPPVPRNAELVYVPPSSSRDRSKPEPVKGMSIGSVISSNAFDIIVSPTALWSDSDAHMTSAHRTSDAPSTEPPGSPESHVGLRSPKSPAESVPQELETVSSLGMTATPNSGREEIEGVLDYYQSPPGETPITGFRPTFSPISEESNSQLSPPFPSGGSTRGKLTLEGKSSTPGGRIYWYPARASPLVSPNTTVSNSESRRNSSLLPIGERPRSAQHVPHTPQTGASMEGYPAVSSSSAPDIANPVTLSLRPSNSSLFNRQRSGSAPNPIRVIPNSHDISTYDITVSSGSASSDGTPMSGNSDYIKQTFPETPSAFSPMWTPATASASTNHRHSMMPPTPFQSTIPTLAQQVLLTHAANGARHSRQTSLTRNLLHNKWDESIPEASESSPPADSRYSLSTSESNYSQASVPAIFIPPPPPPPLPSKEETSRSESNENISLTSWKDVSVSSPGSPAISVPSAPPQAMTVLVDPHPFGNGGSQHSSESYEPSQTGSTSDINLRSPPTFHYEIPLGSPFNSTFGSPPPYDTIASNHHALTPTTAVTFIESVTSTNASPSSASMTRTRESAKRGRSRPPVPAGPRRPGHLSTGNRPRNASVSSVHSGLTHHARTPSAPLASPRFNTPPLKWRGYPMDAAKWTFSSTQLQTIVSHAIKKSAEASFIRLLPSQTIEKDIPDEITRLEIFRGDVKARYKMLTRKRSDILSSLEIRLGSLDVERGLSILEELKEVCLALDSVAEDLHSTDEQLAQLNMLKEVHSASALAMALRKLNSSFLKEYSDGQLLRERLELLELEREEAWEKAQEVASDFDRLEESMQETLDNSTQDDSPVTLSKRFSHVTASRKSSLRVTKAGLRSARSSMSSTQRISINGIPSGSKFGLSTNEVPPVPPIPRRRPYDINTDISMRASMGLFSDSFTPNTENRAMVQAHEELCEILGITSSARIKMRRPRSVDRPPRESYQSFEEEFPSPSVRHGRPVSLPDSSGLNEIYIAMTADRNAMLATLGILADE